MIVDTGALQAEEVREDRRETLANLMQKYLYEMTRYYPIAMGGDWTAVKEVAKGWSSDQKYLVTTREGNRLLLRVSGGEQYQAKKKEYEIIQKFAALGFPMSAPVGFGLCDGGKSVYMLLTWVEGRDLEEALPGLPEEEQYRLGREAGRILRLIHSVPVEAADVPAETKKAKKLAQLARYEASQLRQEGDEAALRYVRENIDQIWRLPPAYLHGDYHPGNLIYQDDGSIGVIDFNRWEVGDPWEEFYKLESFGVECSVPYCVGQIDAYFDGPAPEDFWRALAVYAAHAAVHSIQWAEKFGPAEVDAMAARYRRAMDSYDGFRTTIPKWYTDKWRRGGGPSAYGFGDRRPSALDRQGG